jgi:hypothetical protein
MTLDNNRKQYESLHYFLDLPLNMGLVLAVRNNIKNMIWKIANEEGIQKILQDSEFSVAVEEPAPDIPIIIEIVMTYLAMKAIDKATDRGLDKAYDEIGELVKTKIVHRLREQLRELFGRNARLIDAGGKEEGEEHIKKESKNRMDKEQ